MIIVPAVPGTCGNQPKHADGYTCAEDKMLEKFFPDLTVDSIYDIEPEILLEKNIRGVILDIDNTLVAMHVRVADDKVVRWIERLKESGLKVCIVSNASKTRVDRFNEKLKVFAVHRASKPGSRGLLKASEYMGLGPEEVAVVGDQLFTDIYGGNRLNMFTVLVKPVDDREVFFVRIKRLPEKIVMRRYHGRSSEDDARRKKWKQDSARRILDRS